MERCLIVGQGAPFEGIWVGALEELKGVDLSKHPLFAELKQPPDWFPGFALDIQGMEFQQGWLLVLSSSSV
jgi:hypothetical protein